MNKKIYYEVPSAELIIVRFEENFCQTSPDTGKSNIEIPGEENDDV